MGIIPIEAIIQSNLIEEIKDQSGPLWDNHVLAARMVSIAAEEGHIIHPRVLHAVLFEGVELPYTHGRQHQAGDYRYCQVTVGQHFPPRCESVPSLMIEWWDETDWFTNLETDFTFSSPWSSHAQFESIHPFIDGNGRVGRLVYWNHQMVWGLDIDIIMASDRFNYYQRLEDWRRNHNQRI